MINIEDQVKHVVVDILDVSLENIQNHHSFRDDLGADSLDAVELVMAFEDAFSIEIPEEEARNLMTVQSVIDFLNKKSKGDLVEEAASI